MKSHPLLDALAVAGVKMGLDRMESFLTSVGSPHRQYPVLHVAGTNGKGSVCRMVGAMLAAEGLEVGITTSPHLQAVNERIRIGAQPISDADLNGLLIEVGAARDRWARDVVGLDTGAALTYFEFTVAAALWWFARKKVDVAVVEVGMGGRLDATNVVAPVVTGIVTIGLDHTAELGPDHGAIAAEKAGIVKPGVPVVVGALSDAARHVVLAIAAERGAPVCEWGLDFHAEGSPSSFRYRGPSWVWDGLGLGLAGAHQVHNAGVALALVEELPTGLRPGEAAIRRGLSAAANPGRLEWLAPDLLVDGAHNADGAEVLAGYLAELPRDRPRRLLVGGGYDKDLLSVTRRLAPLVDELIPTAGGHPKARSPGEIGTLLAEFGDRVGRGGPLAQALPEARDGVHLVIVAGSLYLVGEVRDQVGAPPA